MSRQAVAPLTTERRLAISEMVAEKGAVRSAELVERFNVDAATIRRDLSALGKEGRVRRVRGGAVLPDALARTALTGSLGRAVAGMIADGETLFLGPGLLTLETARCLASHSRLTIVTNGLAVAHWVATNTSHSLIVTGGQVERDDMGLAGQLTRSALVDLRADHVVLELGGVSAVGGLTGDSLAEAEVASLLLGIASHVIVLVPAERVGRVAAAHVAPISEVDVVVTSREAPAPALWDMSESGVRIVLA